MIPIKSDMSIGRLMILVFLPATLLLLVYIGALRFGHAIPPLLIWIIVFVFIMLPFQLFIMLRASKKEFGAYSFKSALVYNTKITPRRLMLKALIPFFIAGAVAILIGGIETRFMTATVFKSVPEYFRLEEFVNQTTQYSSSTILLTCIIYVAANVLVFPVVEELYFRGYLMPRIERFGELAPLIITVLFSLYHFWAPWSNVMRILAIFPYTYSVFKNKSIYIGIVVHCGINIVSSASMLYAVYGVH